MAICNDRECTPVFIRHMYCISIVCSCDIVGVVRRDLVSSLCIFGLNICVLNFLFWKLVCYSNIVTQLIVMREWELFTTLQESWEGIFIIVFFWWISLKWNIVQFVVSVCLILWQTKLKCSCIHVKRLKIKDHVRRYKFLSFCTPSSLPINYSFYVR